MSASEISLLLTQPKCGIGKNTDKAIATVPFCVSIAT